MDSTDWVLVRRLQVPVIFMDLVALNCGTKNAVQPYSFVRVPGYVVVPYRDVSSPQFKAAGLIVNTRSGEGITGDINRVSALIEECGSTFDVARLRPDVVAREYIV